MGRDALSVGPFDEPFPAEAPGWTAPASDGRVGEILAGVLAAKRAVVELLIFSALGWGWSMTLVGWHTLPVCSLDQSLPAKAAGRSAVASGLRIYEILASVSATRCAFVELLVGLAFGLRRSHFTLFGRDAFSIFSLDQPFLAETTGRSALALRFRIGDVFARVLATRRALVELLIYWTLYLRFHCFWAF